LQKNKYYLKQKIRVGAVSYLNTKPFIYGLQNSPLINEIELITNYPSKIAEQLYTNEIDLGLVPVTAIAGLKDFHIISNFCIGATGPVASVCLFSNVPLQQVHTIVLDYQSRTSVALVQILATHYWKQNFKFIHAITNNDLKPQNDVAAVVIGDRAFAMKQQATYCFDLAEAWQNFTGLPFVFAAWISKKPMTEDFSQQFNKALEYGLLHLPQIIETENYKDYDLATYYKQNISYNLDEDKKKGLNLFLEYLKLIK
jgi:chorismate dehydratase